MDESVDPGSRPPSVFWRTVGAVVVALIGVGVLLVGIHNDQHHHAPNGANAAGYIFMSLAVPACFFVGAWVIFRRRRS